jgi:hypothetical protein
MRRYWSLSSDETLSADSILFGRLRLGGLVIFGRLGFDRPVLRDKLGPPMVCLDILHIRTDSPWHSLHSTLWSGRINMLALALICLNAVCRGYSSGPAWFYRFQDIL